MADLTPPEPAAMASGRQRGDPYNSSSTSLDTPASSDYVPQHLAHGRKGIHSTASSDYGDFPAPSSSVPSLPRYTSSLGGHSSSDYSSAPGRPGGRTAPGGPRGPSSAGHGTNNGAHPLSNTIYSEANRSQTSALGGDEKGRRSQSSNRPNNNLAGSAGATSLRRPPPKGNFATRVYRAWTGANVGDSGIDERHVKKKRLGYLDGLKFLASILVLNGTLFDAVLTPTSYPAIQRDSPLYIFRSVPVPLFRTPLVLTMGRPDRSDWGCACCCSCRAARSSPRSGTPRTRTRRRAGAGSRRTRASR